MARTRAADRTTRSPSAQPPQLNQPTPTKARSRRGSSAVPSKNPATPALDSTMPKNGTKRPRRSVSYPILEEVDSQAVLESSQQQDGPSESLIARVAKRPRLSAALPTPPITASRKTPGKKKSAGVSAIANNHSSPALPQSSPPLIEERQYTPLRQALDQRQTRRLKRNRLSEEFNNIEADNREDAKKDRTIRELRECIAELELDAEQRRLAAIQLTADDEARDAALDHVKSMQAEITRLKKGLAKQEDDHLINDETQEMDFDVEREPIFIQPEDLGLSQQDVTPRTSFIVKKRLSRQSFGLTVQPSPAIDPAVKSTHKGFEAALNAKAERIAQLESSLESIEIELRSLGFGNGRKEPRYDEILVAIHAAFQEARENVNDLFAEQDLNNVQNGDFLRLLSTTVSELWEEIEVRNVTIEEMGQREAHLGAQTDKLLEKLASAEATVQDLHTALEKADLDRDRLDRELVALREEYEKLQEASNDKDIQLESLGQQLQNLQGITEEQKLVIERKRTEAESYYDETVRQQETIEREKRAFEEQLESLRIIMQEKIDTLTAELKRQTALKNIANEELEAEIDRAARLNVEVENAEKRIEALETELESKEALLSDEESKYENAEVKNEEMAEQISTLKADVAELDDALQTAKDNYEQLQARYDAQTRQREAAETSLDNANETIAERETQLNKVRTEENSLKMKLFAVQQERDQQIKALEDQLERREEEYQNDMQEEVDRRELAEKNVAETSLKLASLEEEIATLESNLDSLSEEKQQLEAQLALETAELKNQVADTRARYQDLKTESDDHTSKLKSNLAKLTDKLSQRDALVRHLEQEKIEIMRRMQTEIKDRDGTIQDLNVRLVTENEQTNNIRAQKAMLEDAVDAEAARVRTAVGAYELRVETLTAANHELTQDLAAKQQLATQALTDHRRAIEEKNLTIESLTIVSDGRRADIEKLHDQNTFLRESLDAALASRDDAIAKIQKWHQGLYGRVQDEAGQLEVQSQEVLARVAELEVVPRSREYPTIITSSTTRVSNGLNGHNHVEMEEVIPSSPFRKLTSILSGSMRARTPRASARSSHVHFANGEVDGNGEGSSERVASSPLPQ